MERINLMNDLCDVHSDNKIVFFKNAQQELFIRIELKVKVAEANADEQSPNLFIQELAWQRANDNCRTLKGWNHNYLLGGKCELEIRKTDLTNTTPNATLVLKADVDPKLPRTGSFDRDAIRKMLDDYLKQQQNGPKLSETEKM